MDIITITPKKLQSLLYAETMLDELSAAGVDNWEGYSEVDWDAIRAAEELPDDLPKGIERAMFTLNADRFEEGYTTRGSEDE